MLGIRFFKAAPTTYVMLFKRGVVKREGAGLSFFYFAPSASLVAVPMASQHVPFAFHGAWPRAWTTRWIPAAATRPRTLVNCRRGWCSRCRCS